MRSKIHTIAILVLGLLVASRSIADDAASLSARQRVQQQARATAAELVSSVLDLQLRQLRENQLEKLPVYADIESMRQNIDRLVANEMQEVVDLLAKAEQADEQQRQQILLESREKIRTIVVTLIAQRQKLYKRMQFAKIAAQARQLVDLETKVLIRTQTLAEEDVQQRERSTLSTLEDHRDVMALYFQLLRTVEDVTTWEGTIGASAAKGLRLLKTLQLDQELKKAAESLASDRPADAENAERAVIKGLKSFLEILEQSQGIAGSDRATVAKVVAELLNRQEQLRAETKKADLRSGKELDEFAERQHEIHQDLGELSDALRAFANTEALAQQAKSAAYEAETKLFEGSQTEAIQQQGQVIGSLAEIEKKLIQSSEAISDKTAEQLAREVQQLENLDKSLDVIRAKQAEVTRQAAQNAAAAKAAEDQVAQQLTQANQLADFGSAIETRLADAQDAVGHSQRLLQDASPQSSEQRSQGVHEATRAIDHAATEVKHALADARRIHLAVGIGELARAAEALERAAAAERRVGDTADEAARSEGLSAETSKSLAAEQSRIDQVTKEIAEGVKESASQVSQQLTQLQPTLQQTAQSLQTAAQNPGPGSKDAARQAVEGARTAAKQIEQAAMALRRKAGQFAAQLAQVAGQQLQPIAAARKDVANALEESVKVESPAAAVAKLQDALDKTRNAQIEQARASGRTSLGAAQSLMYGIERAALQQAESDQAESDLARGKTSSPLVASDAQQRVAELASEIAKQSDNEIGRELELTAQAAALAAKEMVIGNPSTANAARQTVREALERAKQMAQQKMIASAQQSAEAPNPDSQTLVSDLAQAAREAILEVDSKAAESLLDAKGNSQAAEKVLANQQPAAKSQDQAAEALARSTTQLQEAIGRLGKQQSQQWQREAKLAAELMDRTLPVDAGAAAALRQAEAAAIKAIATSESGRAATEADHDVQLGMERAEASLATREQELLHDLSIAEAIARLAREQQSARDQIAQQAEKLEQFAGQRTPPTKDEAAQRAAAQALAQAADQFADAQRATGQGAAEISNQDQVANPRIRSGLEAASALGNLGTQLPTVENGKIPPTLDSPESSGTEGPVQRNDPSELGTGFIPDSPEVTADQIAGQRALEMAASILSRVPQSELAIEGDELTAELATSDENGQLKVSTLPSSKLASKAKQTKTVSNENLAQNITPPSDGIDAISSKKQPPGAASSNASEDIAARRLEAEPWFAKLPPSLQKAIHAKSRGTAPRGYEERLKRYFESN